MRAYRVPLLLFALPAVMVAWVSSLGNGLILERTALANGELWRLWSGHWVHFSGSHLLWNLVVLLAAGAWLERVRPGRLLRHTLIAAPLISLAILALEPGLQTYGGLSGLATGVVVLLGLHQFSQPDTPRWLWAGVLGLVMLKTATDAVHTDPLVVAFTSTTIRSSSSAHAAGALVALLHHVASHLPLLKMTPPGPVTGSRR
jgi:rhomboid family GlyGly-CTERM serine protease